MRSIKNINNNIVLAVDSQGREVIVLGKGIGFEKPPVEIPLNKINRTFYNVKDVEPGMLRELPTAVINAAIKIMDDVSEALNTQYSSTAAFVLADHIQFAVKRKRENIYLELPLVTELKFSYPDEMREAEKALKTIKEITGIELSSREAGAIALHFINDKIKDEKTNTYNTEEIMAECQKIIENNYGIALDTSEFNYGRFLIHMNYLLKRCITDQQVKDGMVKIFQEIVKQYPNAYQCTIEMQNVFNDTY